jgi:hypothetical protein
MGKSCPMKGGGDYHWRAWGAGFLSVGLVLGIRH